MPFSFRRLEIPDVVLITPSVSEDGRGFFAETFKRSEFRKNGITGDFVQDNHSKSKKGVVRGLHYQLNPAAQGKLVRVARGAVLDVAVDIRRGSPHYGKWVAEMLSAGNRRMLWLPAGFAHGICALEEGTEVLYKVTAEYSPGHERGILWNDPSIGITWPVAKPFLSAKDAALPLLKDAENNFGDGSGK